MKRLAVLLLFVCFSTGVTAQPEITKERLQEFKELTLNRVEDLQQYIAVIADRQRPLKQRKEAIDLAVSLFANVKDEKSGNFRSPIMQVSRKDGTINNVPLQQYFNNLLTTRYSHVEITYYDNATVTDFEKGTDGKYHATATYFQKFKGFDKKGQMLYSDKTRKDIAVTGEQMKAYKDANEFDLKVFFGDVRVSETTPDESK